jgi:formylglycine-generating enzyme required for sulfatase activity
MEQQLLKELLANYRNLPTLQQIEFASLLNGLGKIALATGDFSQAREYFAEAASNLQDRQAQAELIYNQHCVALEQKAWADALSLLHEAVALDAERFEPFPFEHYQAERILGAGGFGTAFLCVDKYLDRRVVIKSLQREELSRDVRDVFREGGLLKELNHPFIVKLEHCNFADKAKSRPYLVMEYVDAVSLELYLEQQKKPLSVAQGRKLAVQLAEALKAAHQQNILHRDVKPANVLFKAGSLDLKLIDFGLGLRLQSVQRSVLGTNLNQSILGKSAAGTVEFAAPEQMGLTTNLNVKSVGTYSDVYGFGKTLCYALFLNAQPNRKDWDKLNDVQFADALSECIAREPSERPQSFDAVLKLLTVREETVVEAEVSPKSPSAKAEPKSAGLGIFAAIERAWQWLYRMVVSFFKSLILIVIVIGVIGAIVGYKKDKPVKQVETPAPAPEVKTEPPVVQKSVSVVTRLEFEPEMVAIPAGTFEMGSNDGHSDEKPVHSVSVNGFRMSKYETTVGQFKVFVRDSGYSGSKVVSEWRCTGFMQPDFSQTEQDPVVCVTWLDAEAYVEWLNKKTGKGYRLPTEAEWEYAARAGSATKYWWGDNLGSNKANCDGCGSQWDNKQTAPVGSFSSNGFGLYDTAGNVWEWTCSEYGAYSEGKQTQCNQSVTGRRVLRGGSWNGRANYVRSADRDGNDSTYRLDFIGFRLISP